MEKKPKIDYKEHETPEEEEFPNLSNVASANECTGLMYRTPVNGREWESLQELSPMGIPRGEEELEGNVLERLHRAENAEEAGEAVEAASGERKAAGPSGKGEEEYKPRHLKT